MNGSFKCSSEREWTKVESEIDSKYLSAGEADYRWRHNTQHIFYTRATEKFVGLAEHLNNLIASWFNYIYCIKSH